MPTVSTIFFVLSPTRLDDTTVAIVVELYREDKLEVSTTLATCPADQLAEMLVKFKTHLQGLGMKDRQTSSSSPAVSGSRPDDDHGEPQGQARERGRATPS